MIALAHALLAALALPATAVSLYLVTLTLLSARLPVPVRSASRLRFDVVVPAHNEAAVLGRCLASLRQLHWPHDCVRLLVVADNCSDGTAALARAAGAQVVERSDTSRRGKGYALRTAFAHSAAGNADAVAIVDADSEVSANLLEAFAARIESGAGAVQAHYGVLNPAESWRTGLMAIAHGAFHTLRSQARERLRVSCGLRGNGWCVTHRALSDVPYEALSQTEDLEYGIALGLAGYRVHYAGEARVEAAMESAEPIARRQRQRWEEGRFALVRSQTWPLLSAAARRRSLLCLDLALDLLVPPLSYVALQVAVLLAAAAAASAWQPALRPWLWLAALAAAGLIAYVLRGWQLSGRGRQGLVDLLNAPGFIFWRLWRVLRPHAHAQWAPTPRQPLPPPIRRSP